MDQKIKNMEEQIKELKYPGYKEMIEQLRERHPEMTEIEFSDWVDKNEKIIFKHIGGVEEPRPKTRVNNGIPADVINDLRKRHIELSETQFDEWITKHKSTILKALDKHGRRPEYLENAYDFNFRKN